MSQLSDDQAAWSRNMQSQIMTAIDATGQQAVADCIGVDTTTITKMKSRHGTAKHSDIERVCHILAATGLKVVPANMKCYDAAKIDILFRLAKDNFQRLEEVDDFFHDDAKTQIAEGTYRPRGVR